MVLCSTGQSVRRWPYYATFSAYTLGAGIMLPIRSLFLQDVLHLSALQASSYFLVLAGTGLVMNPVWGTQADRHGPRAIAMAALPCIVVSALLLATAQNYAMALLSAAVGGIGANGYNVVQAPLLLRVFGRASLTAILAGQYLLANVVQGAGALVGSSLVAALHVSGYRVALVVTAVSPVVLIGWLLRVPPYASAGPAENVRPKAMLRHAVQPYRDRRFLLIITVQGLVIAFGFAQVSAVLPVVVTKVATLPLTVFSVLVIVNCVTVIAFQRYAAKWSEGHRPVAGLTISIVWWLAAVIAEMAAVAWSSRIASTVFFILFAILFALGEVFMSPNMQPLVVDTAPAGRLGAYSAAVTMMYGLGLALGPGIGLIAVRSAHSVAYWPLEFAALGLALGLVRLVGRRRALAVQPGAEQG